MSPPWGPWAGRLLTTGICGAGGRVGVLVRIGLGEEVGLGAVGSCGSRGGEPWGWAAEVSVAVGGGVGLGAGVALASTVGRLICTAVGAAVTTTVITWGVSD